MPELEVPGALLSYEVNGSGPTLLLIAGARGAGSVFANAVPELINHFAVITYDRRGHSKSILTGEQDYANRLARDADDAAALLKNAVGGQPSYVFGSSSGAIVARTLAMRHAELIEKVVLHEPPLLKALADCDKIMQQTREVYSVYREQGQISAMQLFLRIYLSVEEAKILLAAQPADPYDTGNLLYWFERELLVYPFVDVGYDILSGLKDKLVLADSVWGRDLPAGRAPQAMAEKLGLQIVTMPGGHVSYLTHAQEFAASLTTCLLGKEA